MVTAGTYILYCAGTDTTSQEWRRQGLTLGEVEAPGKNLSLKYGHSWSLHILLCRNGYYLPGVAQVGADPGGGGGSWHEPVAQTRQVTQPNFCQFVPISVKSIRPLYGVNICQTWRQSICKKSSSVLQEKIPETWFYEIFQSFQHRKWYPNYARTRQLRVKGQRQEIFQRLLFLTGRTN